MGYLAHGEKFDNMLQLMLFSAYFEGILNTNNQWLYDKYKGNDCIFRCSGISVIFFNFCFEKTPLA